MKRILIAGLILCSATNVFAQKNMTPTGKITFFYSTPLENIDQYCYQVPNFYTKVNLLDLLLEQNPEMSKVLIFTATKALADQLSDELEEKYAEQYGVIHSNKSQNHRFNTVNQFQAGNYRFIIAISFNAPWFVLPADSKWFARLAMAMVIVSELKKLQLEYPKLADDAVKGLQGMRQRLIEEEE